MKHKILLISSDYSMFKFLESQLKTGFLVHLVPTLKDAVLRLTSDIYSLNILDIRKEEHINHKEYIQDLTACRPCPTIVLSYFENAWERIWALRAGAVYCLTKPAIQEELTACVQVQFRVFPKVRQTDYPLKYEKLILFPARRIVRLDGQQITLTTKQFDILHYLLANQGIACSKASIYDAAWKDKYECEFGSNSIACQIAALRNNLGIYRKYIKTIFGYGYKI